MSTRTEFYRQELAKQSDILTYLLQHSGLPGPRGNLELLAAVAATADEALFRQCLTLDGGRNADGNSPEDFVVCCGIAGYGHLVDVRSDTVLGMLRAYASDHRWRIREAVVMVFQAWGRRDFPTMITCISGWDDPNPYEMRAIVAALCEPDLLKDEQVAARTIGMLDEITWNYLQIYSTRKDGWQVLEKGLSYGWSVAVAALPELGKERMAHWMAYPDNRVHRIMVSNLKKKRLMVMDANWVNAMLAD